MTRPTDPTLQVVGSQDPQPTIHPDPWGASPNRLLRPEEAAEFLALSRARVYELLAAGEIESIQIGRSRRIPIGALDDYVTRLRNDAD